MTKYRILLDLNIAANNEYGGISTENRFIYKMLTQISSLETGGLITSANPSNIFKKYEVNNSRANSVEHTNYFFHSSFIKKSKIFSNFILMAQYFFRRNNFSLYPIDKLFQDVIWRNIFYKSLNVEDRDSILNSNFYYSDLSSRYIKMRSYLGKKTLLNTSLYDFVVFLEPSSVSVSPNSIKIIRYHDSIPLTEPDFCARAYSRRSFNVLKHCAEDSYIICNSQPTYNTLLKIYPKLENKTFMIPCILSANGKKNTSEQSLKQMVALKLSKRLLMPEYLERTRNRILHEAPFNYIFNLATLDPKKNHLTLIRAWEKLKYRYPDQLKLVIAANHGWFSHEIENIMRPHIEMGEIIHVENLSVENIFNLYSHAKVFIFPSFTEGFGLPPLEAMQSECPTIVSDIPAHRWVLGGAAIYCNPYDANSLTEAIIKLIYHENADNLRHQLIKKGLETVKKYATNVIASQWSETLETIYRKRAMEVVS